MMCVHVCVYSSPIRALPSQMTQLSVQTVPPPVATAEPLSPDGRKKTTPRDSNESGNPGRKKKARAAVPPAAAAMGVSPDTYANANAQMTHAEKEADLFGSGSD